MQVVQGLGRVERDPHLSPPARDARQPGDPEVCAQSP